MIQLPSINPLVIYKTIKDKAENNKSIIIETYPRITSKPNWNAIGGVIYNYDEWHCLITNIYNMDQICEVGPTRLETLIKAIQEWKSFTGQDLMEK